MSPRAPCPLPILILAAGQSSRMRGRDKLMEIVEGKPLIRRQVEMAQATTHAPILVTVPDTEHPRVAALAGCDVRIIPVPDASSGMSASLRRGLEAVPQDCPAVMVFLADLPALTAADLATVCAAVDLETDMLIWRGATQSAAPGHPIVFARALFGPLKKITGDTGGTEVVAQHRDRMVLVPLPDNRARLDLDTPEDWDAWHAGRS